MAQHSSIARSAIISNAASPDSHNQNSSPNGTSNGSHEKDANSLPPKSVVGRALHPDAHRASKDGVGKALTDTPTPTAPPSPQMYVRPLSVLKLLIDPISPAFRRFAGDKALINHLE